MSTNTLTTDAIVLLSGDYLESSRLLSLFTRELGVLSVVARGARSSRKRFGSALQVFAQGEAIIQLKPNRDLNTLISFDVADTHSGIAANLDRFWAASAMAEVVRYLIHEETAPLAYDRLSSALKRVEVAATGIDSLAIDSLEPTTDIAATATEPTDAAGAVAASIALATLWQLVGDAGFEPALEYCAECRAKLDAESVLPFHNAAGGVLCASCARQMPGGRQLPPDARRVLMTWLGESDFTVDSLNARAHQSLLLGFLKQHLQSSREHRAYEMWQSSLK